jgi:hypothetical protein
VEIEDKDAFIIEENFGVKADQLQQVQNFFFMVYHPNAIKGTVRIMLDGTYETTVKRKQLFNIICETCSITLANKIDSTCSNHGEFYLYDRDKNTLKKMISAEEIEALTPAIVASHSEKQKSEKEDLFEKIIRQNPISRLTDPVLGMSKVKRITSLNQLNIRNFS